MGSDHCPISMDIDLSGAKKFEKTEVKSVELKKFKKVETEEAKSA